MSVIDLLRTLNNKVRQNKVDRLGGKPTWCRVPRGFMMKIDPTQGMDIGYYLGTYEPALVNLIPLLVSPGDTVVDVGTHKGYISLNLARAVGSSGKVVSIDPDPRVFAELSDNCDKNGYHHVFRFPCVAGNIDGSCDFSLSSQLGNSSRFPNDIAAPTVSEVISVPMRVTDELLVEAGVDERCAVSFVKIDAEGSEPLVLQGMQRTIAAHRPAVCMEINNGSLRAGGFSAASVSDVLKHHGYRYYKLLWKKNSLHLGSLALEEVGEGDLEDSPCYEMLAITGDHRGMKNLSRFIAG
ncbi:FkbM family methyltransferase [Geomonas paludis]|uniref:FkbM family methyltransferase n=1 Tax=Geomonas paludis TaxID=2740185 RepID=A0ABY4LI22_9BACT|nr:FkbM family methyltransferase [Geomonas paludis]UPU37629.1 FkbM family methyltransferase [Geomonas paludis]